MSNILKSLFIQQGADDTWVVDSNVVLDARMQEIEEEYRQRERQAAMEAAALAVGDGEGDPMEGGSLEEETDYVALAREEAEQILSAAREEAEQILSDANAQAQAMKTNAEREGRQRGYEDGIQQATQDMDRKKEAWEQEKARWIEEYQKSQDSMERELLDVLCQVLEHVFLVQFGDKKELVLHLADNAMANIEGSKEFLIRVGESNYEFLKANKAALQDKVGGDVVLDIINDPLMDAGQCLIETDGGVFDCSVDVEMSNLVKDIKSLDM